MRVCRAEAREYEGGIIMADRMIFPKTIQEFIEEYAVTDENGNMLIPVYRMEQAHIYYGEQIRNKAIDEFFEALKEHYRKYGTVPSIYVIDEIAEQMKGE